MSTEFVAGAAVMYNGKRYFVVECINGKVTLARPGMAGAFIVHAHSCTLLTLDQDQEII